MKKGWQQSTLKDLCVVDWGNTDLTKAAYVEKGEFLAVSAAGCDGRIGHREHAKHTPVLSAIGAQCGKMFFPDEDFTAIKNTITLTPRDGKCSGRFLYYLLTFIKLPQRGAGQPFISKGDIESFSVTSPPLPEQQRIVGILDEAFAGIATAKATTEQNLQNARALFESHLNAVFTQRGEGWEQKRLGDLATFRNGINFTKSSRGESVKIVGVKDFQNHFWAQLDNLDTATTDGNLPSSDALKENDLLFVRSNGNVALIGRCLLVGPVREKITHSGFTIRARLSKSSLSPKFLCHFLKSDFVRQEMINGGIGTNIKSLNQPTLSSLLVPMPNRAEQFRIVAQIECLSSSTARLAALYARKLAALEELKKSLLHQAFAGEL